MPDPLRLLVLSAVAAVMSPAAETAKQLTAVYIGDIAEQMKVADMTPRAFRARAGILYFLFSSASGSHAVATTDTAGKLIRATPVPVIQAIQDWIDVDDSGAILLRRVQKATDSYFERVSRIDAQDGKELSSFEVRPGLVAATVVGSRLVGASRTGLSVFDATGRVTRTAQWRGSDWLEGAAQGERAKQLFIALGAFDSSRVILFQRLDLYADVFDINGGTKETVAIASPMLRDLANSRKVQTGASTLIDSVASDGDGRVYASLGKWDPGIGVRIVRVDAGGTETASYVCGPLARLERFRNSANPDGFMHPHEIQVDGRQLYVYDQRGALIRCVLPAD